MRLWRADLDERADHNRVLFDAHAPSERVYMLDPQPGGLTPLEVIARALRASDRTLAHALFRAALENGWKDAAQQFAVENPSIATVAHDIRKLTQLRDQFGRVLSYM